MDKYYLKSEAWEKIYTFLKYNHEIDTHNVICKPFSKMKCYTWLS